VKRKKPAQASSPNFNAPPGVDSSCYALAQSCAMLDIASRFRYAELLDPKQTRQLARELGEPALSGWVIRMALTSAEFEALWKSQLRSIRLSVEDHRTRQQALVLSVPASGMQFCWVIPLWEAGMWAWMDDLAKTLHITMLAESVEDGQYALCDIKAFVEEDAEAFKTIAAQLKGQPEKAIDVPGMAKLGLKVMVGRSGHIDQAEAQSGNLRTLVVARPANAVQVMQFYTHLVDGLEKDIAMLQETID
jgi:hypothetical protein